MTPQPRSCAFPARAYTLYSLITCVRRILVCSFPRPVMVGSVCHVTLWCVGALMLARRPSAVHSAVGGEFFGGKIGRLSRVCLVMFVSQGSVVIGTTDRTAALQDLPTPTLADVNWMLAESNKFLQRQVQRNEVSCVTRHASAILSPSCITCYTSHVTRHTSHVTRHTRL